MPPEFYDVQIEALAAIEAIREYSAALNDPPLQRF
jgi:hypothetical protein